MQSVTSSETRIFRSLCMAIPEGKPAFNKFETFWKVIQNIQREFS